jgi:hypothetical protein
MCRCHEGIKAPPSTNTALRVWQTPPPFTMKMKNPPTPKVNEDRVNNEPTNRGIFSQQRSPTDSKPLLPPVSFAMNDDCNGNTCCEEG